MEISREEILKAAQDARLELTPEEAANLESTANDIIQGADFLANNELEALEATFSPFGQQNMVRDDNIASSLPLEKALANAPETEAAYILVPKIIE